MKEVGYFSIIAEISNISVSKSAQISNHILFSSQSDLYTTTLARTATIQGQCVTQITEKKCENTKNCGCTQRLLLYIMPQRISSQNILEQ